MKKIVLFSGGRGNNNLLKYISRKRKNTVSFDIIINGLDDGASTGSLRKIFDFNIHGISDFLKVILSLSLNENFINVLNYRVPIMSSEEDYLNLYSNLNKFLNRNSSKNFLNLNFNEIKNNELKIIKNSFKILNKFYFEKYTKLIDFSDFKIGNIVFSSILLENKLNFTKSIKDFKKLLGISNNFQIFENTNEIGFLCGILKNGVLLPNEASIVLTRSTDFIEKIFITKKPLSFDKINFISSLEKNEKINFLVNNSYFPKINKLLQTSIRRADLIVYGSGTPYSSILPSLLTNNLKSTIIKNLCPKVLVSNLRKESSNSLSTLTLIDDVLSALNKFNSKSKQSYNNLLTHVIVSRKSFDNSEFIPSHIKKIKKKYPKIKIIEADITNDDNYFKHDGKKLYEVLKKLL